PADDLTEQTALHARGVDRVVGGAEIFLHEGIGPDDGLRLLPLVWVQEQSVVVLGWVVPGRAAHWVLVVAHCHLHCCGTATGRISQRRNGRRGPGAPESCRLQSARARPSPLPLPTLRLRSGQALGRGELTCRGRARRPRSWSAPSAASSARGGSPPRRAV